MKHIATIALMLNLGVTNVYAHVSTAICCLSLLTLLSFFPQSSAGQGSSPPTTAIVFYAEPRVADAIWPQLTETFHSELEQEESDYPLPESVEAVRASALRPGQQFGQVIEVRLIGRCDVVQQAYRPMHGGPLGWVPRVSGEIQPFIFVNCARLAQFLNPVTLGMSDQQRSEAMARAISRIAIHEWIHIDAQTAQHGNHGIRQAELTSRELVAGSRVAGGR